jgi:hypothetical protein
MKCSGQRTINMKNAICFKLGLIFSALAVIMSIAACGRSAPVATEYQKSASPVVLHVIKGKTTKTFSVAQIKELPNLSGFAGQIDENNKINGPVEYKGVALTDILNTSGGISAGNQIKITSADNGSRIFSYDQVATGNIDIYDGLSGLTTTAPVMVPKLFVAFESNGTPLETGTGPLEFGVMTCQFRVTRDSLWLKNIIKIEIITAQ